jgi:hypothetical protein
MSVALPSILLLSLLVALPSAAQQFNPPSYYKIGPSGAEPAQIVTADFNRDGNLDLAIADTLRGGVAVLLGNGDGTFQPAIRLNVSNPYALAVADVNGDGIPDLLVQQWGATGDLFVYLGNGDGTFHVKVRYPVLAYPIALAVADLNGDGKLDIVVANSNQAQKNEGYVTILFGNGDGTFTRRAHYSAGRTPYGVAVGDLNGDGHPDIVVANDNSSNVSDVNTLYVLLNNGDGTFHQAGMYQTGLESINVSIADLNGDHKPDLVVASAFNQGIAVLLGNGDGSFTVPVFYSTSALGAAPYATVVADFNLDGIPDIATILYDGGVALLYGNGDGTFQSAVHAVSGGTGGGRSLVTGDFNHDGAPDIGFSSFSAAEAGVLTNKQ